MAKQKDKSRPILDVMAMLIPDERPGEELPDARLLPLEIVRPNPNQSRQIFAGLGELADSIKQFGVLEPIVVRPGADGAYTIVAGERRRRAAELAGLSDIPAIIRTDLDDLTSAYLTTIENLQDESLDIEDEARYFAYLLDMERQADPRFSQRDLASKLGKPHNYISERLRLLQYPDLLTAYRDGRLTLRQAMALIGHKPIFDSYREQRVALEEAVALVWDSRPPRTDETAQPVERDDLPALYSGNTVAPDEQQPGSPAEAETQAAPEQKLYSGNTVAAPAPRFRYIEQADKALDRIVPQRVPPAERPLWREQLDSLIARATALRAEFESGE